MSQQYQPHPNWTYRCEIQRNTDTLYIYADDLTEKAHKGQAEECAGEPNTRSIPTAIWCCRTGDAQFRDSFFTGGGYVQGFIDDAFFSIEIIKHSYGKIHILPKIGRGCSELYLKAPLTYAYILKRLQELDPTYKG